jgi:hypothetical protein
MNKAIRLLCAGMLVWPLLPWASTSHLKEGMPFTKARAHLIKDHWKPLLLRDQAGLDSDVLEKTLVKRGFGEVYICSADTSSCIFYYRKGRDCLRLDTAGEQVRFMKLVAWSKECPDMPPQQALP